MTTREKPGDEAYYADANLITKRELAMRLEVTTAELDVAIERWEIPFIEVADKIRFSFGDVVSALKKKSFESWRCRDTPAFSD